MEELPALDKAVSRISDPFQDPALPRYKGLTVSEEQIDAEDAQQILVVSVKMHAAKLSKRWRLHNGSLRLAAQCCKTSCVAWCCWSGCLLVLTLQELARCRCCTQTLPVGEQ